MNKINIFLPVFPTGKQNRSQNMFGIPAVVKKSIRNQVLYCGSITQILVSVTAVRNPLPAEEKKTNYTLFLQRHNIFPQKNNYLNIPAENLNSLSNLRFLQYVSKDKMKFHNPTPEKNENVFPQKMKYTRSDGRQNFIQKMDTISSLWFQISFHLNNSCINKCSYSKVFFLSHW